MLGKVITVGNVKYSVIGVVDDFTLRPIIMDNKIKPAVLQLSAPEDFRYAAVNVSGSIQSADEELEAIWYDLFPQELYAGFLQEEVLQDIETTNKIMLNINVFLATVAILISLLGLYTLIALKVQRRTKEFGVRKVLGASSSVIVHLLGKDFYWIIGIAGIIGLSASYVVISSVFDIIYAYHITAELSHFIQAILSVLFIVALTIGYKVYQTGKLNPATQLRTE